MLRFFTKRDRIFLTILTQAFEDVLGLLELDDDPVEQQETFQGLMPRSAHVFDATEVMAQLAVLNRVRDSRTVSTHRLSLAPAV